jgi:hypothetical protein
MEARWIIKASHQRIHQKGGRKRVTEVGELQRLPGGHRAMPLAWHDPLPSTQALSLPRLVSRSKEKQGLDSISTERLPCSIQAGQVVHVQLLGSCQLTPSLVKPCLPNKALQQDDVTLIAKGDFASSLNHYPHYERYERYKVPRLAAS